MTNEELDKARAEQAWSEHYKNDPASPTVIAARLAREGWTPPAPVDPEVGSIWKHYNGTIYEVIAIANTLDTEKYPKAVIHKNRANGTVWTRRADDWHRSYTQQAKTSEPSVDPDIAIAKQIDAPNSTRFHLAFTAIKRGRALAAAEAKPNRAKEHIYPSPEDVKQIITDWENSNSEDPGNLNYLVAQAILHGRALAAEAKPRMVWVKHDGSRKCPVPEDAWVWSKPYTSTPDPACHLNWQHVTHYAVITPPEEK